MFVCGEETGPALGSARHPEAEVSLMQDADRGPLDTVIYGIPLGEHACAVSHAAIGLHPGSLGAAGALPDENCLRAGR